MPKGYPNGGRTIICEQCGESYDRFHRTCPYCGAARELSSRASSLPYVRGPYKKYQKHEKIAKGNWTVTLVNGKQQIAATISGATVQKILAMLAGEL